MDKQECISQLEDLKKHCMDWSPESPGDKNVEALDMAIAALKGTAPEVPVQEQLVSSNLKANITIKGLDVLKNISTNSSIDIETICTDKASVEVNLFES